MSGTTEYQRLRDCAAYGCERTRDDGYLERISPKGKGNPFVALCADHYGRVVVLKPVAATLMELAGGHYDGGSASPRDEGAG